MRSMRQQKQTGEGLGGDHHDPDGGKAASTHAMKHLEAVHNGHVQIDQGRLERAGGASKLKPGRAVGGVLVVLRMERRPSRS